MLFGQAWIKLDAGRIKITGNLSAIRNEAFLAILRQAPLFLNVSAELVKGC